jgi:hypothetical protein
VMAQTLTQMMAIAVWSAAFASRVREFEGEDVTDKWIAEDAADKADRAVKAFEAVPANRPLPLVLFK